MRILWVVLQMVPPQHFGNFGHTHRGTRVSRVGFLDGIHRKGANGVGDIGAVGLGHEDQVKAKKGLKEGLRDELADDEAT
jgi:hypothetical protein